MKLLTVSLNVTRKHVPRFNYGYFFKTLKQSSSYGLSALTFRHFALNRHIVLCAWHHRLCSSTAPDLNCDSECLLRGKSKADPVQAWTNPEGSRNFRLPAFMKVVKLSASRTGSLYLTGNIPGNHFCYSLIGAQNHSAAGRITSMTPSGIEPETSSSSTNCATA